MNPRPEQFEAVAPRERVMYLLAMFHGQAANILQGVAVGAAYEDIVGALKGR
jgi:hypothetical protein